MLFQPVEPHQRYHIVRLFYPLSFIRLVPEAAEYVLPERHIGKQGVILKKITHPALLGVKGYALSAVVEYHAVQLYVSAVRPFYARDALERHALAAAGGAQYARDSLPRFQLCGKAEGTKPLFYVNYKAHALPPLVLRSSMLTMSSTTADMPRFTMTQKKAPASSFVRHSW